MCDIIKTALARPTPTTRCEWDGDKKKTNKMDIDCTPHKYWVNEIYACASTERSVENGKKVNVNWVENWLVLTRLFVLITSSSLVYRNGGDGGGHTSAWKLYLLRYADRLPLLLCQQRGFHFLHMLCAPSTILINKNMNMQLNPRIRFHVIVPFFSFSLTVLSSSIFHCECKQKLFDSSSIESSRTTCGRCGRTIQSS